MARPTKQTPEIISNLEQTFSIGATITEACFSAGIGESTYHRWCDENEALRERFSALRNNPVLKARQVVFDAIDAGDTATAKGYLERKKKDEFSLKSEVDHSSGDGLLIAGDILSKPTVIELVGYEPEATKGT